MGMDIAILCLVLVLAILGTGIGNTLSIGNSLGISSGIT